MAKEPTSQEKILLSLKDTLDQPITEKDRNNIKTDKVALLRCIYKEPAETLAKLIPNLNNFTKEHIEAELSENPPLKNSKEVYYFKDSNNHELRSMPIIKRWTLHMITYLWTQIWSHKNGNKPIASKAYLEDNATSYTLHTQNAAPDQDLRSLGFFIAASSQSKHEKLNELFQKLTGTKEDYSEIILRLQNMYGTNHPRHTSIDYLLTVIKNPFTENTSIIHHTFALFDLYLADQLGEQAKIEQVHKIFREGKITYYDASKKQKITAEIDYASFARCAFIAMITADYDRLSKCMNNVLAFFDEETKKLRFCNIDFDNSDLTYAHLPTYLELIEQDGKLKFKVDLTKNEIKSIKQRNDLLQLGAWLELFEHIPHDFIVEAATDFFRFDKEKFTSSTNKLMEILTPHNKTVSNAVLTHSFNLQNRIGTIQKIATGLIKSKSENLTTSMEFKFPKRSIRDEEHFKKTEKNVGSGTSNGKQSKKLCVNKDHKILSTFVYEQDWWLKEQLKKKAKVSSSQEYIITK